MLRYLNKYIKTCNKFQNYKRESFPQDNRIKYRIDMYNEYNYNTLNL